MSDIAIRVKGLSKEYRIGARQETYKTLRDTLTDAIVAPFRRASKLLRGQATGAADLDQAIWALKDVSFDIKPGEVVGLIGRNGAGKSTLLKILARITEPTEGGAEIYGRVGSLLEVGTGFHAELTGRENIYLNGAILGMKRDEITRKFDEIVAFAEVEKFIDTPVKHYSSGMYLRLAFAVAAHLEPEILLVDEVLAVGDARFQRKCLNKMQDVGQQGRTVIFVSHNMPAITRLCARAILLDEGSVCTDGSSHQVISAYLNSDLGTTAMREWHDPAQRPGKDIVRLCAVRVQADNGKISETVDIRRPVGIEMEYEVLQPGYVLMPHYHFYNEEGVNIFSAHDTDVAWRRRPRLTGRYVSTVWIPGNLMAEGMILVDAALTTLDPNIHQFTARQAVAFQVIDALEGDTARGDWAGRMKGVVRPLMKWTTQVGVNGHEAATAVDEREVKQ
jgi:lipopolysaccharide transport system ATP-binding protein